MYLWLPSRIITTVLVSRVTTFSLGSRYSNDQTAFPTPPLGISRSQKGRTTCSFVATIRHPPSRPNESMLAIPRLLGVKNKRGNHQQPITQTK